MLFHVYPSQTEPHLIFAAKELKEPADIFLLHRANHVDQLNLTVQNINTVPPLIAQVQNRPIAFPNCDYYSLIVSNDLDIPNLQPFTMETDRSLTEYMDDEVKAVFSTLSEEVQKRILTFPSIFANENTAYGHTDE